MPTYMRRDDHGYKFVRLIPTELIESCPHESERCGKWKLCFVTAPE